MGFKLCLSLESPASDSNCGQQHYCKTRRVLQLVSFNHKAYSICYCFPASDERGFECAVQEFEPFSGFLQAA